MAPVEWTEQNRRELVDFFNRETGQKLKEFFDSHTPRIEGDTIEQMAMSATSYESWRRVKETVKMLLTHSNTPDKNNPLRATRFIDTSGLDVKK